MALPSVQNVAKYGVATDSIGANYLKNLGEVQTSFNATFTTAFSPVCYKTTDYTVDTTDTGNLSTSGCIGSATEIGAFDTSSCCTGTNVFGWL